MLALLVSFGPYYLLSIGIICSRILIQILKMVLRGFFLFLIELGRCCCMHDGEDGVHGVHVVWKCVL